MLFVQADLTTAEHQFEDPTTRELVTLRLPANALGLTANGRAYNVTLEAP